MKKEIVNMTKENIIFLKTIDNIKNKVEPYDEFDIGSFVFSPKFYNHLVKVGLVKRGEMKFNGYLIEIDDNKHADIWGINGKRK